MLTQSAFGGDLIVFHCVSYARAPFLSIRVFIFWIFQSHDIENTCKTRVEKITPNCHSCNIPIIQICHISASTDKIWEFLAVREAIQTDPHLLRISKFRFRKVAKCFPLGELFAYAFAIRSYTRSSSSSLTFYCLHTHTHSISHHIHSFIELFCQISLPHEFFLVCHLLTNNINNSSSDKYTHFLKHWYIKVVYTQVTRQFM